MICVTSAGNSGNSANPHIATPADAITTLTVGGGFKTLTQPRIMSLLVLSDHHLMEGLNPMFAQKVLVQP